MSYKELYAFCQTLTPKIHRNNLRDKTLELTGIPKIKTVKTTLDISICRGFYLSAKNKENKFVQQNGYHLIVLARSGLNPCWERFVYVKELMHSFDDPEEATDSGECFEKVLTELQPGTLERSSQTMSELKCFWMALAALCPEKGRIEFKEQRKSGHIDDYGIALQLKIPRHYVPLLFEDRYEAIISKILK